MIFGTVCSGIGAPEAAWAPLGWRCAFMSEIEPFPRAVLAHHYPGVPLHGDFTTIQAGDYAGIDLLCGGTPCQAFSVAGLRGGMADARGNLALEFLRLADRLRPRWMVWENVPGVRSSGGGRDFGAFLGGLGELGYGWAYRSLDAQYSGLAQRRERVFVVGHLGDWRPAAAVLFEPQSLRGDTPPRRETGQGVARPIAAGSPGGSGYRNDADTADNLIAGTLGANGKAAGSATQQDAESGMLLPVISPVLKARDYKGPSSDGDGDGAPLIAHTPRAEGFDASEDGTGRGVPLVPMAFGWQNSASQGGSVSSDHTPTLDKSKVPAVAFLAKDHGADAGDIAPTLRAMGHAGSHPNGGGQVPVAFDLAQITSAANRTRVEPGLPASTLAKGSRMHAASMHAVRRLTPAECEALQGFPKVKKSVIVLVCSSDRQKASVLAEIRNHRSQKSAWNADASASMRDARNAELPSSIFLQSQEWPVALRVQIELERGEVQLHSQGRLIWSASIADGPGACLPLMPLGSFVHLCALLPPTAAKTTQDGKAESPQSTQSSIHPQNGSALAPLCGHEIAALAKDAEAFTSALSRFMKSITSEAGSNSQNCERTLETWSCFVAAAINGCIPEPMRAASSYALSVEISGGYTLIPYRKGLAADGPRYRALGNSMAVPVMAWIGRRVADVDASVTEARHAA